MLQTRIYRCSVCHAVKRTLKGLCSHISQSVVCRKAFRKATRPRPQTGEPNTAPQFGSVNEAQMFREVDTLHTQMAIDNQPAGEPAEEPASKCARVEEIEDEEVGGLLKHPFVKDFPFEAKAGASKGHEK